MHRFAFFLVADIRDRPGGFWLEFPGLVGVFLRWLGLLAALGKTRVALSLLLFPEFVASALFLSKNVIRADM